jgi:hypothetical protein
MFAGAVSGPTGSYINSICNNYIEVGIPTSIAGILAPLILAGAYIHFKYKKRTME